MEGHNVILWSQDISSAINGEYNLTIVFLSYLIASIAGMCAFSIINYIQNNSSQRTLLIALGGSILGLGIWSMHYTGMMAFTLPIQVLNSPKITFLSIIPAVLASIVFLNNLTKHEISYLSITTTALVLASGITAMHFIGMSAMSMQALMSYDPILLLVSVLSSWGMAVFTIVIKSNKLNITWASKYQHLIISAVFFGFSVASMHYLAMLSTYFFIDESINVAGFDNSVLSKSLIFFTMILMLTLLLILYYNQKIFKLITLKDTHRKHVINTIDNMQDGFVLSDDNGKSLLINSKFKQIFFNDDDVFSVGCNIDTMYSQLIDNHFKFESKDEEIKILDILQRKYHCLEPIIIQDKYHKFWLLRQNKTSDHTFIQTWTDVSLQEQKDRELVEAKKMAALGGVVAGVAHELNTPLGVSITSVSRIAEILNDIKASLASGTMKKSSLEKSLQMIANLETLTEKNLHHMAALIQKFKYISIDQEIEDVKKFTLSSIVLELTTAWDSALDNKNITLITDFNDDIVITGYKESFIQVLDYLYNNSFDHAFNHDKKGVIEISAYVKSHTLLLTFSDDGCGIPIAIISRIFEPFVTTKRTEGGIGLGLHIAHNLIVHKMGGKIKVEDIPSKSGTKFSIELPLISSHH